MNVNDFINLSPLIALVITCAILLFSIAIKRNNLASMSLLFLGMISSFISTFFIEKETVVLEMIKIDHFSILSFRFLILCGLIIGIFIYENKKNINKSELYLLFLLSLIGGLVITLSYHWMMFFLGLGLLSISLYAMIAYDHDDEYACESATKYLVLGGIATAIILFGIVFVYAETKTFVIKSHYVGNVKLLFVGYSLILSGLALKLSLIPFHFWALDVFMGASTPVMAHLLIISKGAILVFLFKLLWAMDPSIQIDLFFFLKILSLLSILGGSLLALWQTNLKRLIASSSIASMGYILLLALVDQSDGSMGFLIFAGCYFITALLFCGVLNTIEQEEQNLHDLPRWSFKSPINTIGFIIAMLSLMGTPLTVGLIGKWAILQTLVTKELFSIMAVVILGSALGIYAYLRVVISLFGQGFSKTYVLAINTSTGVIFLLASLVMLLGLWPSMLWELIRPFR